MTPTTPPPRDKAATKLRLLRAATAEFAEYGLSGARIDRIAAAAEANKRMIYLYFGNKEELFDYVVADALQRLIDAVPLTPDDLPRYAGGIFDALIDDPSVFRLSMWRQLERPQATDAEVTSYADKENALSALAATSTDPDPDLPPGTVIAIILAVAQTWHLTSPALQGALPEAGALRAQIVEAVRRMTTRG